MTKERTPLVRQGNTKGMKDSRKWTYEEEMTKQEGNEVEMGILRREESMSYTEHDGYVCSIKLNCGMGFCPLEMESSQQRNTVVTGYKEREVFGC